MFVFILKCCLSIVGEKQSKESQHDEQTDSEGQDNFYDTVGQLDLSQNNIAPLPDGEGVYHTDTHTCSSTLRQLDAKSGAQDKTTGENNMSVSDQIVPLDSKVNKMVQSSADQMDHKVNEMAASNSREVDLGLNKVTSSVDLEEDDLAFSTVTEKEEECSSYLSHTGHSDKGEEESPVCPEEHVTSQLPHSTQDYVELQRGIRVLPLAGQEEPRDQTEARASDAQMDQLEENIAPRASVVESQLPDEAPSWEAAEEDTLHVSIPEIVVSSPVPTDDESSDGESAVEGDTNEEQREVESSNMERWDIADDQSHADSSWKFPSSHQEADAIPDQTKPDNTCLRQEGDISDSNLLPLGSTADYLASTEASSETNGEEAIDAQSSRAASQGSVPNLGERASSLLSQLRSEIASMKTARLASASPIVASDSDGNATEIENANGITSQERDTSQPASQERDTSQPASQQRDTSQPASQQRDTYLPASQQRDTSQTASQQRDTGPVSAVTYRLPLFEDVDSTCTSFSLDDILSEPAIEEAANYDSDTDYTHKAADV